MAKAAAWQKTPWSYLTHLECTFCGETHSADEPQGTCPGCGKVLYPRYDLAAARGGWRREALAGRPASLWRYHELLPVRDPAHAVTLDEGFTPLLHAPRLGERLGCPRLYIKDEGRNPTGTFKARGLAVAISRAKELGLRHLTLPSAGNAAGALAAYCARAGLEAHVFMPRDAPLANKLECEVAGARLVLVDGHIGDAGRLAREWAGQEGLFDLSTLREPYRVEGKKTLGYELAEQMGWKLPDVIVYPTGGGTGLVGMWKAFGELEALGWTDPERPRMVCVQAEGCAPLVRAFHGGLETAEPWRDAHTIAAGLRVPSAIGDYLILRALRESGGTALTVTDGEMLAAVREMASLEGVFACPEGAATLAGLRKLLAGGLVRAEESVVLCNTGSGLKYLDVLGGPASEP